jgi:hypothetical protein
MTRIDSQYEKITSFVENELLPLLDKHRFTYNEVIDMTFPLIMVVMGALQKNEEQDLVYANILYMRKTLDNFCEENNLKEVFNKV